MCVCGDGCFWRCLLYCCPFSENKVMNSRKPCLYYDLPTLAGLKRQPGSRHHRIPSFGHLALDTVILSSLNYLLKLQSQETGQRSEQWVFLLAVYFTAYLYLTCKLVSSKNLAFSTLQILSSSDCYFDKPNKSDECYRLSQRFGHSMRSICGSYR